MKIPVPLVRELNTFSRKALISRRPQIRLKWKVFFECGNERKNNTVLITLAF